MVIQLQDGFPILKFIVNKVQFLARFHVWKTRLVMLHIVSPQITYVWQTL